MPYSLCFGQWPKISSTATPPSLTYAAKSNMSVLKEFKLAEVSSLSAVRIVGSDNTTINYRTLLDDGYLTNLDLAIVRDTNIRLEMS